MNVARHRWLLAAVLVGAIVRLPGVAWGLNWPDGFTSHHPDEYTHVANADAIVTPLGPATAVTYPKAMGAHAAMPYLLWYALHGQFGGPRVHIPFTIGAGRLIAVGYGLAAIVLVFLIGRDALGDARAGLLAAWLLALGGLHVTQSHFFLSDVPAVTWTLAAAWCLWRDVRAPEGHEFLRWGAFAAGAAFAFKLFVFAFPALAYAVLVRPSRLRRAVHAIIFTIAGIMVPSLGFETTTSLYRSLTAGINFPFEFDRAKAILLYAVQMPGILSFPLLLLGVAGTWSLLRRLQSAPARTRRDALAIFGSIPLLATLVVLVKLDHFPRHWLFLVPWAALAGGWFLARWMDRPAVTPRHAALLLGSVFLWMLVFVVDSERLFIFEPRNAAMRWLRQHVPEGTTVNWVGRRVPNGYRSLRWMVEGDPDYLVVEMHEMNNSLSGVDWRNSMPADPRRVFDGRSAERVQAIQALFRGSSDYQEVARFSEGYLMPEYRLGQALVGDRSRSYISEIVIFRKPQLSMDH